MSFEVVSVKVQKVEGPSEDTLARAGEHLTITNVSVRQLIADAYLPYNGGWTPDLNFLISGALPNWTKSEHFDIDASAVGDPTIAQKQLMLQSMLEDRFKLVMHHETPELPVFALVLVKPGKTGPQLLPHADNTCVDPSKPDQAMVAGSIPCGVFVVSNGPRDRPSVLIPEARGITMPWFAQNLGFLVNRIVVDRTGLSGTFDLKFTYSVQPGQPGPARPDPTETEVPSIFTALQDALGLKLESQTSPVDVLVVDHIEEPTPN